MSKETARPENIHARALAHLGISNSYPQVVYDLINLARDPDFQYETRVRAALAACEVFADEQLQVVDPWADAQESASDKPQKYILKITNVGPNKINVIKVIREITGLGLAEAKNRAESCKPTIIGTYESNRQAQDVKQKFEAAGATVEIR